MPTPLSSILGGASAGQRRATYVLTSSNASFPIPSWAQGGNGVIEVYGTAPGGSGAVGVDNSVGSRGGGGGAGAAACGLRIPIPAGTTTIAVVVGAQAIGPTATAMTNGTNGGDNSLTVGTATLVLQGGGGGTSSAVGGPGGLPRPQANVAASSSGFTDLTGYGLSIGQNGRRGNTSVDGFGAGAPSLHGNGGAGVTAPSVTVSTPGASATGRGSGGAGANYVTGAGVKAGDGAPGFWDLTFIEGAA